MAATLGGLFVELAMTTLLLVLLLVAVVVAAAAAAVVSHLTFHNNTS